MMKNSLINEIISKSKDYFVLEIKERELMSKGFSKYIASLDYFDKSLIVLSATSGGISIASFLTIIGGSTCRNSKCKFESWIFNFYRNCNKILKDNAK